jgi:hypothetical protein
LTYDQSHARGQQLHDLAAINNVPPPPGFGEADAAEWRTMSERMNAIVQVFNTLPEEVRRNHASGTAGAILNDELSRLRDARTALAEAQASINAEENQDVDEEVEEWDGEIIDREVETQDYDSIQSWSTWERDHHGELRETEHQVELAIGDFTPPGADEPVEVYRWQSADVNDGDYDDAGDWTIDRSEAVRDGERYANRHDEDRPEDEPEDDEDSSEFSDLDADAIFGAEKLGLRVHHNGKEITINHPKIAVCNRTFGENSEGRFIHNDIFCLKKEFQGDGFGSDVLYAEVEGAIAAGFDWIETFGARSNDRLDGMNGYYTWLTLGYDQSIDQLGGALGRRIKELVPGAKTMQDLMDHEGKIDLTSEEIATTRRKLTEIARFATSKNAKDKLLAKAAKTTFSARDWWLANGTGLPDLRFDLHEGSRSLKVMQRNIENAKAKAAARQAATAEASTPVAPRGTAGQRAAETRRRRRAEAEAAARAGATGPPPVVPPTQPTAGQRAAATRRARETKRRIAAEAAGLPVPLTAGQRAAATRRQRIAEAALAAAQRQSVA